MKKYCFFIFSFLLGVTSLFAQVEDVQKEDSEPIELKKGLFYTVQLGVYNKPIDAENVFRMDEIVTLNLPNGQIRYSSGIFNSIDDAKKRKSEATERGINGAFITAYYDGQRIKLSEAKQLLKVKGNAILQAKTGATESNDNFQKSINSGQIDPLSAGNAAGLLKQSTHQIKYSNSSIFARSVLLEGERVFLSNADGSVYCHELLLGSNILIFKMGSINEMRDIEKSGNYILAMHSGENGKIARIGLDGSIQLIAPENWIGVSLNGMDIIEERGFMMGSPTNGHFNLFHSNDGGVTWLPCDGLVQAKEGEKGLSASGTNVQLLDKNTYAFVSGGTISRFFKSTNNGETWNSVVLPYYPGFNSGGYSMCFSDDKNGVIVGGDHTAPDLYMNTCFYTSDGGESWYNAKKTVRGYRSCVYHSKGVFYACGTNGIDYSTNNGVDWKPFANGTFYAMSSSETHLIATSKKGTLHFFELITKD